MARSDFSGAEGTETPLSGVSGAAIAASRPENWQREMEATALMLSGIHPNTAVVGADNALAQR